MKQFLSIMLRTQFNLFYRFGYTFTPKSGLIEFNDIISSETQENIIKQFATVTPFEYDEEYLIVHLEKSIDSGNEIFQFEIQDIVAVYPLSQQAKMSIESKIDQRIRLENPIFETLLPRIEIEIEHNEIEKAINALWKICKIDSLLEECIAHIGLEHLYKGLEFRKNGTKANKIQNGNYWEYLIAYDRFDYYPNSTLGYFYDAGQVFAFSKGLQTFEGSGIHCFLEELNSTNPTAKLPDIIKYFETEELLKGYVTQTTTGDMKQYIVAPLYLMLRDEIRKSDDIAQTKLFKNLDYLKKFDDSFNYAVILLGAFFGFRKFYDNYYEALNLRFYKGFEVSQNEAAKEVHQEQATINLINEFPENCTIDPKVEEENLTNKSEKENKTEELAVGADVEESVQTQETSNFPSLPQDNQVHKSDISTLYQKIIQDALSNQPEIKITDIIKMIKKQTGRGTLVGTVENVAKQMSEIEIITIDKSKGIRKKGNFGQLSLDTGTL